MYAIPIIFRRRYEGSYVLATPDTGKVLWHEGNAQEQGSKGASQARKDESARLPEACSGSGARSRSGSSDAACSSPNSGQDHRRRCPTFPDAIGSSAASPALWS